MAEVTRPQDRRLKLSLYSPEGLFFEDYIKYVELPQSGGKIGVLPDHAPLITLISDGRLVYQYDGGNVNLDIGSGIAKVENNDVLVLVDKITESQ